MRFFSRKEPKGSIFIHCERTAKDLYTVSVHGSGIIVPTLMEQEIKDIVSKYINGHGYDGI